LAFYLPDPGKTHGWYWKILHIAQKGLFLYPARKNVPGPAGVLSYHARERNILPKARSWKFSGRFRAGEQIHVRAAPPPPNTSPREIQKTSVAILDGVAAE